MSEGHSEYFCSKILVRVIKSKQILFPQFSSRNGEEKYRYGGKYTKDGLVEWMKK